MSIMKQQSGHFQRSFTSKKGRESPPPHHAPFLLRKSALGKSAVGSVDFAKGFYCRFERVLASFGEVESRCICFFHDPAINVDRENNLAPLSLLNLSQNLYKRGSHHHYSNQRESDLDEA